MSVFGWGTNSLEIFSVKIIIWIWGLFDSLGENCPRSKHSIDSINLILKFFRRESIPFVLMDSSSHTMVIVTRFNSHLHTNRTIFNDISEKLVDVKARQHQNILPLLWAAELSSQLPCLCVCVCVCMRFLFFFLSSFPDIHIIKTFVCIK